LLVFNPSVMLARPMKSLALMTALTLGLLCQPGSAAPAATIYEVKQGDSLAAIARKHKVTPAALAAANGIKDQSKINIGQKLKIPGAAKPAPTAPATPRPATPTPPTSGPTSDYIVAQGDSFYRIAKASGLTVAQLVAANPGTAPNSLRIGQVLKVPASPTAAAAPTTAPTNEPTTAPLAPAQATVTVAAPTPDTTAPDPRTAPPVAAATPPAELEEPEKEPVPPTSGIELIKLTSRMTFAEFANAHQTTTERLNTLNGWNLPPNAVLAPESEFWVPKQ